jgi:antagonist of KipI
MDPVSHRVANALVGNASEDATLEVTLIGPELDFEDERVAAVAGAGFELILDGRAASMGSPFVARAGSRLRFGPRVGGTRAYLAVEGGIAVPPVFGSRSTHVVSRMGGLDGRALLAGDRLPLGRRDSRRSTPGRPAVPAVGAQQGSARIRVVPGPDDGWFAADALARLQSAPYVITTNSDRMGFRLEGPALAPLAQTGGRGFISDATLPGAVQVPASGQPILLMADRQTTGGYPKIATVISADISVAGQLGPGDALSFIVCSRLEAVAALIAQERALMALEAPADR